MVTWDLSDHTAGGWWQYDNRCGNWARLGETISYTLGTATGNLPAWWMPTTSASASTTGSLTVDASYRTILQWQQSRPSSLERPAPAPGSLRRARRPPR